VLLGPTMAKAVKSDVWTVADYSVMAGPLRQIPAVRQAMLPGFGNDDGAARQAVVALVDVRNEIFHLRPLTAQRRREMIQVRRPARCCFVRI
jgi:hypothetical protein